MNYISIKRKTLYGLIAGVIILLALGIYLSPAQASVTSRLAELEKLFDHQDMSYLQLTAIGEGMAQKGGLTIYGEDALEELAAYKKEGDRLSDREQKRYRILVSRLLWQAGYPDEALDLLAGYKDPQSQLHLGIYSLLSGDFQGGESILLQLPKMDDEVYEAAMSYYYFLKEGTFLEGGTFNLLGKDFHNDKGEHPLAVSGYLEADGSPLVGAMVVLYEEDYGLSGTPFYGAKDYSLGLSNQEGYFEIYGPLNGKTYQVAYYMPWQMTLDRQFWFDNPRVTLKEPTQASLQVAPKARITEVTLEEGKLSFTIADPMMTPERTYGLSFKAEGDDNLNQRTFHDFERNGNTFTFDLDQHRKEARSLYSLSYSRPFHFSAHDVMEPLYLEGDYQVMLSVYDDKKGFNSLFDYRDLLSLHLAGQEKSRADQLLFEGRLEEAIELLSEEESLHNMKVLAELYTLGYYASEDGWTILGRDLEKAIYYEEKLFDILKDQGTKGRLIKLYDQVGDKDRLLTLSKAPGHYFKYGHYEEALAMLAGKQEGYEGWLTLGNQDLPDDYQAFLQVDKSGYEDFFTAMKKGHYEKAQAILDRKDQELARFYSIILSDLLAESMADDRVENYVSATKALSNQVLQDTLKALKEGQNWFDPTH